MQEQRRSIDVQFLWRDFVIGRSQLVDLILHTAETSTPAYRMLQDFRVYKASLPRFVTMLGRYAQTKCSDPRDRVYALRSFVQDGGMIPVDYNVDAQAIFDSCVRAFAPRERCLYFPALLIKALELEKPAWQSNTTSESRTSNMDLLHLLRDLYTTAKLGCEL